MEKTKVVVLYRVCDSVQSYSTLRTFGDKRDILNRSVESLATAVSFAMNSGLVDVSVELIFNNTSENTMKRALDAIRETGCAVGINMADGAGDGNMLSFRTAYKVATKHSNSLLFFLEDDYILDERCIEELAWACATLKINGVSVCAKPNHDAYAFTRDGRDAVGNVKRREILLGKTVYWFRDCTSTCTFCIPSSVLNACSDLFEATFRLPNVYEVFLNRMWERYPLVASIPPLAEHMQDERTVSPFYGKWRMT